MITFTWEQTPYIQPTGKGDRGRSSRREHRVPVLLAVRIR